MSNARKRLFSRAAERHAVLTWRGARQVGMSKSSFHDLLRLLDCPKLLDGAHMSPGVAPTPHAWIMAAVLVTGEDAVASHATALRLWGLFDLDSSTVPDVTLPHERRVRTVEGVRVHRTRYLPDRWVTEVDGIPVTSPARSLRDVAASVRTRVLRNLVIDAEQRRLVTLEDLQEQLARRRTAAGASRYRTVVRSRSRDRSDSGFEADVRTMLVEAGIEVTSGPEPVVCLDGRTRWVDLAVVGTNVVLECDGKAFHEDRRAFTRDRRRWFFLEEAGRRIVWVTVDMLDDPKTLVARVRRAIKRDRAQTLGA